MIEKLMDYLTEFVRPKKSVIGSMDEDGIMSNDYPCLMIDVTDETFEHEGIGFPNTATMIIVEVKLVMPINRIKEFLDLKDKIVVKTRQFQSGELRLRSDIQYDTDYERQTKSFILRLRFGTRVGITEN